jgi:hypothetical protein
MEGIRVNLEVTNGENTKTAVSFFSKAGTHATVNAEAFDGSVENMTSNLLRSVSGTETPRVKRELAARGDDLPAFVTGG